MGKYVLAHDSTCGWVLNSSSTSSSKHASGPLNIVLGQPLLYGCPDRTSVDLHIVIGGVVDHQYIFGRQVRNQFVFQPTNNHFMVHFPIVIATRAMSLEHNCSVGYESLIVHSM